jgi:hypothetical protein
MDEETTAALLNFSYHLACGNTDEAYKSVTWWALLARCARWEDGCQKCWGNTMGICRIPRWSMVLETSCLPELMMFVGINVDKLVGGLEHEWIIFPFSWEE